MKTYSTVIDINTSPGRVWDVLRDVERWPEWTPTMRKLTILDGKPLGQGSAVRVEQPKLLPQVMTITSWEPGKGFVWETKSPGVRAVANHQIVPTGSGSRVTLSVTFSGFLTPVVTLLAGRLTARYIDVEANGLKVRCEAAR